MKIVPFSPLEEADNLLFLGAIEKLLSQMIPSSIREEMEKGSLRSFLKSLPLVRHSPIGRSVSVTLLCPSQYTHGVGRYFHDTLARWLVPGKILSIVGVSSLNFSFPDSPRHRFYIHHAVLDLETPQDKETATINIEKLTQEMQLNIQAVYRARYLASLRSISLEQRQLMIEQTFSKMFKSSDSSLFDEMHRVLLKISSDQKMEQVKQAMHHLAKVRPHFFDRETFYEMTHFTGLLNDEFTAGRTHQHLSRIIALHYLFKKSPLKNGQLRVFASQKRSILCICLGLDRETDFHLLLRAARLCLPSVVLVENSPVSDFKDSKTCFFYFEIKQPDGSLFSATEISHLRSRLEDSISQLLENQDRLTFLPRNEEDVARNLIWLSHELNVKTDVPQTIIHYERQTQSEIVFSVLLVRLLLPGIQNLRQQLVSHSGPVKFSIDELRSVGKLKNKIVKEAAVLSVSLDRAPFLRSDGSIHPLQARQKVADALHQVLGNYRDFNGGMIIRQEEALRALRLLVGPLSQETTFLLETYFYSLRPGMMQTILPTQTLKAHFVQLLELQRSPLHVLEQNSGEFVLFFLTATDSSTKNHLDMAIEKLGLPPHTLFSSVVPLHKTTAIGYLLRLASPEQADGLRSILHSRPLRNSA